MAARKPASLFAGAPRPVPGEDATASRRRSPISRRPGRRWTCGPAGSRAASCSTARPSKSKPPCIRIAISSSCACVRQLLADGRLGVDLKFPGVSAKLNPDPADWTHPEAHSTRETARGPGGLTLARQLDDTRYSVRVASDRELDDRDAGDARVPPHRAGLDAAHLVSGVLRGLPPAQMPDAEAARDAVAERLGELLDERRRGRLHRQPRSARQRARAAHRDVAVPHGHQQRGQRAAAGRGAVLQ